MASRIHRVRVAQYHCTKCHAFFLLFLLFACVRRVRRVTPSVGHVTGPVRTTVMPTVVVTSRTVVALPHVRRLTTPPAAMSLAAWRVTRPVATAPGLRPRTARSADTSRSTTTFPIDTCQTLPYVFLLTLTRNSWRSRSLLERTACMLCQCPPCPNIREDMSFSPPPLDRRPCLLCTDFVCSSPFLRSVVRLCQTRAPWLHPSTNLRAIWLFFLSGTIYCSARNVKLGRQRGARARAQVAMEIIVCSKYRPYFVVVSLPESTLAQPTFFLGGKRKTADKATGAATLLPSFWRRPWYTRGSNDPRWREDLAKACNYKLQPNCQSYNSIKQAILLFAKLRSLVIVIVCGSVV